MFFEFEVHVYSFKYLGVMSVESTLHSIIKNHHTNVHRIEVHVHLCKYLRVVMCFFLNLFY